MGTPPPPLALTTLRAWRYIGGAMPSILLIDDVDSLRQLMRRVLRISGYTVTDRLLPGKPSTNSARHRVTWPLSILGFRMATASM
jgi:hypothetical protein